MAESRNSYGRRAGARGGYGRGRPRRGGGSYQDQYVSQADQGDRRRSPGVGKNQDVQSQGSVGGEHFQVGGGFRSKQGPLRGSEYGGRNKPQQCHQTAGVEPAAGRDASTGELWGPRSPSSSSSSSSIDRRTRRPPADHSSTGRRTLQNALVGQEWVSSLGCEGDGFNITVKLDLAKIFDRVACSLLQKILQRVGLSENVLGPELAASVDRRGKDLNVMFKLDLAKLYDRFDRVSWRFLQRILQRSSFSENLPAEEVGTTLGRNGNQA